LFPLLWMAVCLQAGSGAQPRPGESGHWVGTWAAAPQLPETHNLPPAPGIEGNTLRQVVRVSIGGRRIRVRFSNAFGRGPLTIAEARIALPAGEHRIDPKTARRLTFSGEPSAIIPAGAPLLSDPVDFPLAPLSSVSISIYVSQAPADITGHPGARCTSYLQAGQHTASAELPGPVTFERWYLLSGIDVDTSTASGAVAVLGDSLTDGRGSTTNRNRRWTDFLAERLVQIGEIGVLNLGLGGNRLLEDGLGPNALARLDRDVLSQGQVRWLVVLEGINDIGTSDLANPADASALVHRITSAYEKIVRRAQARGIRVFGGTLLPFAGSFYFTAEREAARRAVNDWIRTAGRFDAVIDFEQAVRDPENPDRLLPELDSGDHLHLNDSGYRRLADSVDIDRLFR
jgi:lysophospholipase L1-like esterase